MFDVQCSTFEAAPPLLDVRDLRVHFPVRSGIIPRRSGFVRAVDGVTLDIRPGETLGLVGESGCGKSTLGKAIVRLLKPTSGSIRFESTDITDLSQRALRPLRRDFQMIFQDPAESLDPRMSVRAIIEEPFIIHGIGDRRNRRNRRQKVDVLLDRVGLPAAAGGLECVVVVDGRPVGLLRFRDRPRKDGATFVEHLGPAHGLKRVMLVSGDRESEVKWLADHVGITEVHAGISPEGKLRIVEEATREAPTLFVGDGINDAPALAAATVGIAMGTANDVTGEAAGAVVMDSALERVDELFHIGKRLRTIALQSAVGGMAASLVGMGFAAAGLLSPAVGALVQEAIDVVAVLNALRVASDNGQLTDYGNGPDRRGD